MSARLHPLLLLVTRLRLGRGLVRTAPWRHGREPADKGGEGRSRGRKLTGRLQTFCSLVALLMMAGAATGQVFTMKDGKVITAKGLRRQGDQILATVELAPADGNGAAKTGELGYAVAQIAHIDFPEPPVLRAGPEMITQGKAAEALTQLEPVLRYYEGFRDAPGSWWVSAALLKVQALTALGREAEGEPLATQVARSATDPEAVRAAQVQLALGAVRKGQHEAAQAVFEKALQESREGRTLAAAAVGRAQCLLAKKEWDDAVLSFLQVPVFYPTERVLLPAALLGVAQAEEGMEDLPRAKATLAELLKTYAGAPEASLARAELDQIARHEKALAPPR